MTQAEKDHRALVRLLTKTRGGAALDSAIRAGVSLTYSERQALRFKPEPTALDSRNLSTEPDLAVKRIQQNWATTVQPRGDRRLSRGPVDGLTYKHPGQSALDSNELENRDLFGVERDVNDPEEVESAYGNDAEIQKLIDAISSDCPASVKPDHSTVRNSAGARETGLETANREYAARRNQQSTRVS